jgi:hypothetical protein
VQAFGFELLMKILEVISVNIVILLLHDMSCSEDQLQCLDAIFCLIFQFQLFIWFRYGDLKFSEGPFYDRVVIDYLAVILSLYLFMIELLLSI